MGFMSSWECTNKISKMNEDDLYVSWRKAVDALPPYSKTTAYTQLPAFKELVKQGEAIVPMLEEKVRKNEGLDFILAIAIVQIRKWDSEKFPFTDMTEYRKLVLEKLEFERKHPTSNN
jgi:hypothetical protein